MQDLKIEPNGDSLSGRQYLYEFRRVVFRFLKNENFSLSRKLGTLVAFHNYIEGVDEAKLKISLETYDFSAQKFSLDLDKNTVDKIIAFLKKVGLSGHSELDSLICDCIKTSNYASLNLDYEPNIDRIMSNYLIHQMFKELYPFISVYNKMDSFQYLLKKVQILRVLIAYDGCSDDKRVVRIIQMFSKGLEHYGAFHYEIEGLEL